MTAINGSIGGELSYNFAQTIQHVGVATTFKVGSANAHAEQCVASKGYFLFGAIEGDASRCVARGTKNLKLVSTKTDDLVRSEEMIGLWLGPAQCYACHILELA